MQRYYKFSDYFKKSGYKCKVYKITVDAGFSCPNRDGKLSDQGCIYCDNRGFSVNSRKNSPDIKDQIAQGITALKKRYNAEKFIVYFQAYTNTYAPLDELKQVYDTVKDFDDVVGVSIGTRPDCVNEEILELIDSYTKDYEVWIEYGLQSIHNKTLKYINRGHLYEDFQKALELTRKKSAIKICAHVIVGLPFEDEDMIFQTAQAIGDMKLEGIKIHPMHIIKSTRLEELYNKGEYKPLEIDEYINLAAGFLERIWKGTVVQRITADCPRDLLAAPLWMLDKNKVLAKLEETLELRDTCQGRIMERLPEGA